MVSVIIPTYNRMGTLERSIESVLKQTYVDFELLIIDDGSNDGTEEYVCGLQDERIRYYRNESNMGPSASRNKGAALAKGEYLAFQDSDDEWLPDKLQEELDAMMQSEIDIGMVYHEMQEAELPGEIIPSKDMRDCDKSGKVLNYMLLYPFVGLQAALIRKECFDACGGFDETLKSLEDYEFFLRLVNQYEIVFIPKVSTILYDSPGSVNKRFKDKIDTELTVVKMWYNTLFKEDLLQKKIELVRLQADNYGCEDYFYDKVFEFCRVNFSKEQAEIVLACVHRASTVFLGANLGDRSVYYQHAAKQIERLMKSLYKLRENIRANTKVLISNQEAICEALSDVLADLQNYSDLALYPQKEKTELDALKEQLRTGGKNVSVISDVVNSVLEKGNDLLHQIGATQCVCTACGNQVRFLPLSSYQSKVREQWGCAGANKEYLFEDEEKDRCPICGATQQIRFLLGFMEDIQGEAGEQLKVSCIYNRELMGEELSGCVEKYTTMRDDMEYVSAVPSETKQDVLVAVNIFDGTKDIQCLENIRNQLTNTGICILMLPAIMVAGGEKSDQRSRKVVLGPGEEYTQYCYTENELADMAKRAGFELQIINQNWFGQEYFEQFGFGERAKIYMLTICED